MILTISLLAGVAGVTGAASLTRYLCEALGAEWKFAPSNKRSSQWEECAPKRSDVDIPIPADIRADPQLVRSLLDDAEIKLRVLRREMPGPRRSFKLIKLVESYHPELQPKGHHMKELGPVFAHVRDVVKAKADPLLTEDLQSGIMPEMQAQDAQPLRSLVTV